MNSKSIAIAGALLLSTSGLVLAAGTTIIPAGQSAQGSQTDTTEVAQAQSSEKTAQQETKAAPPPAQSEPASSGQNGDATAAADSQASEPAQSETAAAGGDVMKPDAHPSKDTVSEGNEVASVDDLGKATDSAGNPTYQISADGTADWYTWRGYKKYMANCMQCHGPDGLGSSFAPNLTESLQTLNYFDFAGIIVSGQQNKWNTSGNSVMPAWGEDPNVMCSLDPIYIYLRARADGVVGRGEPKRPKNNDTTKAAQQEEYNCLGF
ncbi:MAG: c-type cytochrome [Pseudomonadota bacterium]|nr:c-type cytochrome [Pseudomonadota bacterium]